MFKEGGGYDNKEENSFAVQVIRLVDEIEDLRHDILFCPRRREALHDCFHALHCCFSDSEHFIREPLH